MQINTDINILGGMPDWNLLLYFYKKERDDFNGDLLTTIKTHKSIKRFEKAIKSSLLNFNNKKNKFLYDSLILSEGITKDALLFIFWNMSLNNELFHALNTNVYFKAFYNGRVAIRNDEVIAYINDVKPKEPLLQKWSDSTIKTTASKYLTLLKKFNLLAGKQTKNIVHPFLNDKMFVIFIYWLVAIDDNTNVLQSEWLNYGFMEKVLFLERIKKKTFSEYFNIYFTGDRLKFETKVEYNKIYEVITRN